MELLSFSASYEDIPDEVGPDHFFPVTWNPMNMMDRFQKTEGVLDARRIGYDSLSPFFEGMLRQTLPEAEFVGVEDMMRALKRVKLPEEITCIRTAAAIAESSLYAAITEVRPGVTEHHLRGDVPRSHVHARHVAVRAAGHVHRDRSRCTVPLDDQRSCPARGRLGRARRRRAVGRIRRLTRPHVVVR